MEKRPILTILIGIFLINFVSAFSFGEFFDSFGQENFTLFMIFFISLAIINFSLSKVFSRSNIGGGERKTPTIISLFLALGITYAFYKNGWSESWNIWDMLFILGIPEDILPIIIGTIILVGILYLLWGFRKNLYLLFLIPGVILIAISFTNLFYESGITFIIGIILTVIGLLWWFLKRRRGSGLGTNPPPKTKKQRYVLSVSKIGKGKVSNKGTKKYKAGKRVTVKAKVKKAPFKYFSVNGSKVKNPVLNLKMNQDYNVVAVFGKKQQAPPPNQPGQPPQPGPQEPAGPQGPPGQPQPVQPTPPPKKQGLGIRALIIEAKAFRQWADSQKNPKFYRNYPHFLSWLKKKGHGKNEKEIIDTFGVDQATLIKVFKKYIQAPPAPPKPAAPTPPPKKPSSIGRSN